MPKFDKKPKAKIEEVARDFGKAHAEESQAKSRKEKFRKMFFDLIEIPSTQLARQTIFAECDSPANYVATLYPKWRVVKADSLDSDEWRILIEEDPDKKNYVFINPLDKMVYSRTVAESAPGVDTERLKAEDPNLWEAITVQPPLPERTLKPLSEFDEEQRDKIKKYLTPVTLQNRMEKPRKAKAEELEGIDGS